MCKNLFMLLVSWGYILISEILGYHGNSTCFCFYFIIVMLMSMRCHCALGVLFPNYFEMWHILSCQSWPFLNLGDNLGNILFKELVDIESWKMENDFYGSISFFIFRHICFWVFFSILGRALRIVEWKRYMNKSVKQSASVWAKLLLGFVFWNSIINFTKLYFCQL